MTTTKKRTEMDDDVRSRSFCAVCNVLLVTGHTFRIGRSALEVGMAINSYWFGP
jgi:RNase P subunit RPR2